jgi:hypothetical protein
MSIRRRGQSLEPDDVDAGLDVEPDSPDELDVVEVDVFSGVFDDPSPPESLSLSPES